MFILMGETEKTSPLQQGQFDCPVCNGSRSYSIHHSTAYFTIFGISVARMNTLSHYLACDCCTSCFSPQILEQPAQHIQAIDHDALFRVLCYLLSGYGDTVQSRQRLLGIYKSRYQQDKSLSDIDNELNLITSGNAPTLPYLNDITYLLSPVKKQQLVIAAYEFSNGSCMMEHHDRVRINTIGSSIGLSLPEIEYLIVNNQ
jgi:hypothetical protein